MTKSQNSGKIPEWKTQSKKDTDRSGVKPV